MGHAPVLCLGREQALLEAGLLPRQHSDVRMLAPLLLTLASALIVDRDSKLLYRQKTHCARTTVEFGIDDSPYLGCSTNQTLAPCRTDDLHYLPTDTHVLVHHQGRQVCHFNIVHTVGGESTTEFLMCYNLRTNTPVFST